MSFKTYDSKTDSELMVLVQRKDHRAFSELYDRYAPRLNAFFFRMLWSDSEMARDYVQELFTKLIHKADLYDGDRAFEPWLFRIASNMCKNAYRKAAFEQAFHQEEKVNGNRQTAINTAAIDHAAQEREVHQLLEGMDEDRRTIFLLRYQQDLSIREIAELLSMPEGTVKSKIFYTKAQLRKSLIE
ncbi:MAG: RNA polymerase sigma factor [Bacteroidota bacterium]